MTTSATARLRPSGTNSVYAANQLNQYTEISDSALSASPRETFTPQFDDDGNQTLVKTETGIWQVIYNGENRPIQWTLINSSTPNSSSPTLLSMSYDRMGRRVTKNNQRFVYDGYLQIANFELQTSNIKLQTFIWDTTEKVATRPLVWNSSTIQPFNFSTSYYTHDGNKNVSEVVAEDGDTEAHYEYAPFGAVIAQRGASAAANPWRFSSEYAEDDTATVYYNYRHYEPVMGRWCRRDPARKATVWLYLYAENDPISLLDYLGLDVLCGSQKYVSEFKNLGTNKIPHVIRTGVGYASGRVNPSDHLTLKACCKCVPHMRGPKKYQLMVEVKASYSIDVVDVDALWYGGKKRTQEGYERTLAHEQLHVNNFKATFDAVLAKLSDHGYYSRKECYEKRKILVSKKFKEAQDDWNIRKMNEAAHSGESWDDWRKNNGKSESDEELW